MGGAPRRSLPRGTGWVMRVKAPLSPSQAFAKSYGIICPSRTVSGVSKWHRVRTGRGTFGFRWSLAPALYPASSLSEKVSFNRINRKTGNRLKQQNVDAETGEVVPRDDRHFVMAITRCRCAIDKLPIRVLTHTESECTHDGARWIAHKRTSDKPGASGDWTMIEKSATPAPRSDTAAASHHRNGSALPARPRP